MRAITLLNDNWTFTKPGCAPESVTLPHTWNAVDGTDGGNDYYRGTCVYTRRLHVARPADGGRVFIEFRGAAMSADVAINGSAVRHHDGGFSTFRADITDFLTGDDELSVAVDNSANDRVYPQTADFTFYGGLYRDVALVTVPETHFDLALGDSGLKVTPVVDGSAADVTVEARVTGDADKVLFVLNGKKKTAPVAWGRATAVFHISRAHLWNGTEDPYLYSVTASLGSGDEVTVRFGCRSMRIDPEKGFILNDRPYPLRGVSRHQDRAGLGSALTVREHREDIAMIREMGANTIRLAHYQHAQEFYDLCDETGIVVWAEIPYISRHMPNGRANTMTQMEELVTQNYNHPSIAVWGLSNEITASPAEDKDDLLNNHHALNDLCHRLDSTRPTAMANVFMLDMNDPILSIPDVNSYNLYYGWYLGELEQNEQFLDEYHRRFPRHVIGLSEYGAICLPRRWDTVRAMFDERDSDRCAATLAC